MFNSTLKYVPILQSCHFSLVLLALVEIKVVIVLHKVISDNELKLTERFRLILFLTQI